MRLALDELSKRNFRARLLLAKVGRGIAINEIALSLETALIGAAPWGPLGDCALSSPPSTGPSPLDGLRFRGRGVAFGFGAAFRFGVALCFVGFFQFFERPGRFVGADGDFFFVGNIDRALIIFRLTENKGNNMGYYDINMDC